MKIYIPKFISLFATLAVCLGITSSCHAVQPSIPNKVSALHLDTTAQISRVLLFDNGDDGSMYYRIPAICTASDGAFVEIESPHPAGGLQLWFYRICPEWLFDK